jgi:hypothetical protein
VWCSVFCPFLFVFYINDVSMVIKYSRFNIYADDLQIFHSSSVLDLQRCYDEINMDLQHIHEWATIKLNEAESGKEPDNIHLFIHRCRADFPPPALLIDANVVITRSEKKLSSRVDARKKSLEFFKIEEDHE